MEPRVHTGVNVELGWHVLPLAPRSCCFLPHSTASSKALCKCLFHASGSYSSSANSGVTISWNHWGYLRRYAEWRITGPAGDYDKPESIVRPDMQGSGSPSIQEHGPNMVRASCLSRKARNLAFYLKFLGQAGSRELACGWTFVSCLPDYDLHFNACGSSSSSSRSKSSSNNRPYCLKHARYHLCVISSNPLNNTWKYWRWGNWGSAVYSDLSNS